MRTINSTEEARAILRTDKTLMIRMGMDFRCWIQQGVKNADGILTADGKIVAQISKEVFDALEPGMDQAFCSEYFQRG